MVQLLEKTLNSEKYKSLGNIDIDHCPVFWDASFGQVYQDEVGSAKQCDFVRSILTSSVQQDYSSNGSLHHQIRIKQHQNCLNPLSDDKKFPSTSRQRNIPTTTFKFLFV